MFNSKEENMSRTFMIAVSIVIILSLVSSGLGFAQSGLPTWQKVFDPGPYLQDSFYINAVHTFKGNLYAVAASFWGGSGVPGGQIFRSPDGIQWTPVTGSSFGLGAAQDGCSSADVYDTS